MNQRDETFEVLPSVNQATGEIVDGNMLDEAMVATLAEGQALEAKIHERNGRIEQALQARGDATKATTIYGKGFKYVISTDNKTDWPNMPPVLEHFTPEEKAEAYKPEHTAIVPAVLGHWVALVPEHEELVPAKWAPVGTIEKLARRHGKEALAAVAKFPAKVSGKLVEVTDDDDESAQTAAAVSQEDSLPERR